MFCLSPIRGRVYIEAIGCVTTYFPESRVMTRSCVTSEEITVLYMSYVLKEKPRARALSY